METKDYWDKNIFYHYGVGYIVTSSLQTLRYKPEQEYPSEAVQSTTEGLKDETQGIGVSDGKYA